MLFSLLKSVLLCNNHGVFLCLSVGQSKDSWSVKSKAAVLLALVVKRSGQALWQALQPQLLLQAQQGPVQAEMVSFSLSD